MNTINGWPSIHPGEFLKEILDEMSYCSDITCTILGPIKDTPLQAGMIFTVEPGIYIPDWGGIRLENMVRVREEEGRGAKRPGAGGIYKGALGEP